MSTDFVPKMVASVTAGCLLYIAMAASHKLVSIKTLAKIGYFDALVCLCCYRCCCCHCFRYVVVVVVVLLLLLLLCPCCLVVVVMLFVAVLCPCCCVVCVPLVFLRHCVAVTLILLFFYIKLCCFCSKYFGVVSARLMW